MKTLIDWSTDGAGMIVGARVHDAYIKEFFYEDGRVLRVTLVRTDGHRMAAEFSDILAFGTSHLSHGAIVAAIFSWKLNAVPRFLPRAEDNPWRVLYGSVIDAEQALSIRQRLSKESPDASLAQVSCSVGGSFCVICKSISFFELSP